MPSGGGFAVLGKELGAGCWHGSVPRDSEGGRGEGGTATGNESDLSAYAERFVLSIKSECLERIVPLGEGHLRPCHLRVHGALTIARGTIKAGERFDRR